MRIYHLLFCLIVVCVSCKMDATSSNNSNSSSNSTSKLEKITKVVGELVIDGHGVDKTWEAMEWRTLDNYWLGEVPAAEDFSGKYKLSWNEDYIYVLAEIQDDILIDTHEDGLDRYWDDDCLELFIDEDNSGGNHQYNHSAYAYHIATNLRVADIGTDSIPIFLDHHLRSAKVTSGTTTTWEVAVRIMNDNPTVKGKARKLKAGEEIGFMIAYCDNDSSIEREHFIGSIPVEGEDKNRGWIDAGIFNDWLLTE